MRLRSFIHTASFFLAVAGFTYPTVVSAFDVTQAYVQPKALSPLFLPPPPVEGSAAWRKQVDEVIRAQRNLSPADVQAARDEQKVRVEMLTSVLGDKFKRERLPKTFAFLDHVLTSASQVSEADKKYWHTRRPYLTDPQVKLYVDPIDASPAYPSGHTASARVLAEVLGMLLPEKLSALRARADLIALHRVQAGVHYPVDLEGGRALALLIIGAMASSDYFQDDLAIAKKELETLQ